MSPVSRIFVETGNVKESELTHAHTHRVRTV